ncbi:MBL fold metallo-hydrolase [bacterium]|nr:MAG: MBL fold metallo-hydrolase [bacterium]
MTFPAASALALPNPAEIIAAKDGSIKITPIFHAALQIEYNDLVFQIDPFGSGDYTGARKADYILVTHTHPDHLDAKTIRKLINVESFGTTIFCPKAVAIQLKPLEAEFDDQVKVQIIKDEDGFWAGNHGGVDWELTGVPSYNIVRGPKPDQKFHPKGQFNGYILELGGKRIYIAGDTEATPEMKALENIDIAFLPMNLPYTMTPTEAADAAKAFKPKIVYPYHYRYPFDKTNDNPQVFQKALTGSGIQVRLRGWYAHPAPK